MVAARSTSGLTSRRIERICEAFGWKTVAEIDGLKVKHWLSRQKLSHLTRRYYTIAIKGFTNFLALNRRIECDPLRYLKTRIKGVDDPQPTKVRRALTPVEMNRLVRAARASRVTAEGLTGEQRAWLYQVAVTTGFRASELSSLTPRSFSLDETVVLLERNVSKRRRYDRQELPPTLVDGLRRWLADKPPDARLWPSFWRNRAARMLRVDLKVAQIPAVDHEGIVVDFHSLRVTYITNLCGSTNDIVLVQRLARLSTVALLNRYAKHHNSQRMAAVAALPVVGCRYEAHQRQIRSDLPQADRRIGQGRRSSEDRQRPGSFMAVSVEIIGRSGLGPLVSVAHYYEQNGDLMRDPDVVFLIGADRHVYPISFRQDNLGINLESAYVEDGVWKVRREDASRPL